MSVVDDELPEEPEAPLSDELPEVDPLVPPEEEVLGLEDEPLAEPVPLEGWSVLLEDDEELGVDGTVTEPEVELELELGGVLGVELDPALEEELGGVLGVALDPELDELLGEDMLPLAPPLALPEGDEGDEGELVLEDDDEAPRLASGPRSQP